MQDQIKSDLIAAIKAGDSLRTMVLRMLLSEMNYKKIDLGHELADSDVVAAIQKEAKKRREAIDSYKAGGRPEQAESEQKELFILEAYLPAQMSESEIVSEVEKLIADLPDRDFGKVMRVVSPVFRGRADGTLVARIVKELLTKTG